MSTTLDKAPHNIIDKLDQLLPKQSYLALMQSRGVVSISRAGAAMLERDGLLALDYVRVGNHLFVPDTSENEARMAAIQKRRDERAARGRAARDLIQSRRHPATGQSWQVVNPAKPTTT